MNCPRPAVTSTNGDNVIGVNLRTVATLLAIWCVLVVGPAFLVLALFTNSNPDEPITGWIFGIWIVGYLAQLGVFMAAARKAGSNTVLGWFIASLAPWAADWSAPVAWWGPVLVLVVVVAYSAWFYSTLTRSADLQAHGIPATGTVLEVKKPTMNMIINSVYIRRTMRLRIERSDGATPYEGKYSGTFMLGEIPSVGDVFNLRVDPNNPRHFETADGVQSTASPAGVAATWAPGPPESSVTDQLRQLADMHSRGDLTDAEFTAAKARLLRE